MADVQLADPRNRGDRADIERGETVTGVEGEARVTDGGGGAEQFRKRRLRRGGAGRSPVVVEGVRPSACVQLADRRTDLQRRGHLPLLRIDEDAHGDSAIGKTADQGRESRLRSGDIESALGGHLLPPLRNEHRRVGADLAGDPDHLLGRRHLQIEPPSDRLTKAAHIEVLDVTTVLAQVNRDSIGAAQLGLDRRRHGIGLPCPARLPDGRDMIDIDAQCGHPGRVPVRIVAVTDFDAKLAQLEREIAAQGDRVLDLCTRAVESYFDLDLGKAQAVVRDDDEIDRIDVEIERRSVPLLGLGVTDEHKIREVLTIVKVNNELERIADAAVVIAEHVIEQGSHPQRIPPTFRVMANSVLGVLRDSVRSMARRDAALARQVLLFDDTIERFKREILLHAQEQVALGTFSVHFAFRLMAVVKALERIADHCTNICEQVIYLRSGLIVRHRPDGWSEPEKPDA